MPSRPERSQCFILASIFAMSSCRTYRVLLDTFKSCASDSMCCIDEFVPMVTYDDVCFALGGSPCPPFDLGGGQRSLVEDM